MLLSFLSLASSAILSTILPTVQFEEKNIVILFSGDEHVFGRITLKYTRSTYQIRETLSI